MGLLGGIHDLRWEGTEKSSCDAEVALGHKTFKTPWTAGRRKYFSGQLVVCTNKHTFDLFVCLFSV